MSLDVVPDIVFRELLGENFRFESLIEHKYQKMLSLPHNPQGCFIHFEKTASGDIVDGILISGFLDLLPNCILTQELLI